MDPASSWRRGDTWLLMLVYLWAIVVLWFVGALLSARDDSGSVRDDPPNSRPTR